MDSLKPHVFSVKESLSESDLKAWCKKKGLAFNLVDLQNLDTLQARHAFVFTGEEKDAINKGHDHHWLFIDGRVIFDSYGRDVYNIPEQYEFVVNNPTQLQEYNSTVCGEYCAAFYDYISRHGNESADAHELGEGFSNEFGFTKNRLKNDEKVYNWFHEKTDKSSPSKKPDTEINNPDAT
jgi:hypothetical protein